MQEYKIGDAVLGRTTKETDLGVTFSADMKVSEQGEIAASKGKEILGLRRTITYKEIQPIVPMYIWNIAWRPYCNIVRT